MNIFITHYTPLVDRKEMIVKQLENENIKNYEFIENYDKEEIKTIDTEKFTNIKLSEISLFLKHVEIFKKELDDIVIILEDDAILVNNFKNNLNDYLDKLQNIEWDILFCGECCNLHFYKENNKIFYETTDSRGTCMYILNKGVSKKIYDIFINETFIDKAIDLWFNNMSKKYNLKYLWSEPTLVHQGSEIGIFNSAIR